MNNEELNMAAEKFNRNDAARMWDYEGKTEGEIVESAFKAGAKWMREQMMKEAVDATIIAMKSGDKYCQAYITDRNSLANMCNGDTVKLIIVKEVKE